MSPVMRAPLADALEAAWRRLPHDLERHRVENTFHPPLPAAVVAHLLNAQRLEGRLARRVGDYLNLARPTEGDFQDPGARIVFAGRSAVEKAMRLAGAIRHRERIRTLVLRNVRAEVCAGIGEDAFSAALSCPETGPSPDTAWNTSDLIQACLRDGPICVACWVKVLPPAVGGWLGALIPTLGDIGVPDYPDRNSISAGSLAAAMVVQSHE